MLKNYTPYRLAYRLAHNGKEYDDKEVEANDGMKQIARWVRLHPYNISQKVAIIVEHFRNSVAWTLNGEAKAMVVTGSRKEAVRYKLAIDSYIRRMVIVISPPSSLFQGTLSILKAAQISLMSLI